MSHIAARAGNDALKANPTKATIDITTHGSDWLWAVFAVMLLTDLLVIVWMFTIPRGRRVFHQLCIAILTTASIAYFCMASDLGDTGIVPEFIRDSGYSSYANVNGLPTRSIWYVRYIDWTITTPLLLLELLLATGLPLSEIFTAVFFDLVMIITGLIGSLVTSSYKWGFWTFGCFAMFYVFYVILGEGRASAKNLNASLGRSYFTSVLILSVVWFIYPIAWALCDGGNVISPDSEMVFYGVLDLLAKPVFCLYHLFQLRNEDLSVLALQSGKASDGVNADHRMTSEKYGSHAPGGAATGVTEVVNNTTGGRPGAIRRRTSRLEAQAEGDHELLSANETTTGTHSTGHTINVQPPLQ